VTHPLDSSQRRVVEADPSERLVVVAGAGQGKTEVIAARIDRLVGEGLSPMEEILVLTFSRAAVTAVRRRVEQRGSGAVSISTFDSFASQLLVEMGEDLSSITGFDRRVRAATAKLREETPDRVDALRHVLLDEVQDLVGDRAEFALAILGTVDEDCGFTAMGDPLQAIYDWQLTDAVTKTTSGEVLGRMVDDLGARVTSLDVDYRARGPVPRDVVRLGREVRSAQDPSRARLLVSDAVADLMDLGELDDYAGHVDRSPATTALLCRTNGDALVASRTLRSASVRHVLRRPLDELGAARWVAAVLGAVDTPTVDRDDMIGLAAVAAPTLDPEDAWVTLKEAERGKDRGRLSMSAVRDALRDLSTPAGLLASDDAGVVVSTVHRAKGLEFDRVLLPLRSRRAPGDEDPDTEMRVSYVALSRARDDVFTVHLPGAVDRMRRVDGRWVQFMFKGRKNPNVAIEMTSSDTVSLEPVADDTGDAAAVQERLLADAVLGATVRAWLEPQSNPAAPTFSIRLPDDGGVIGRTTSHFGRALAKVFGNRRPGQDWPTFIEGMSVAAVETVAGDPALTRDVGLAGSGLWLVPRLTGLARPDWPDKQGNE
jgi:DNA helicase-2/ATP-dependent DNA helicase PcrA